MQNTTGTTTITTNYNYNKNPLAAHAGEVAQRAHLERGQEVATPGIKKNT